MKNGNISNRVSPYVFFQADNLLYKYEYKERSIFGIKLPKVKKKVLNKEFRNLLDSLWRRYDISIVLFFLYKDENEKAKIEEWLNDNLVIYSFLIFLPDVESLREEKFMYLFSDSDKVISEVSKKGAMNIKQISEVFK